MRFRPGQVILERDSWPGPTGLDTNDPQLDLVIESDERWWSSWDGWRPASGTMAP